MLSSSSFLVAVDGAVGVGSLLIGVGGLQQSKQQTGLSTNFAMNLKSVILSGFFNATYVVTRRA